MTRASRRIGLGAPITSLLESRQLVYSLTRQRILLRYRGSMLGIVWAILSPALTLGIFTFVFGVMLRPRLAPETTNTTEFALLLYLGLCVFWFVSECVGEAPDLVTNHSQYVKKVVFPLEILPWVSVANALFHTLVRLLVFALACVALQVALPWSVVLVPLVWLPLCLTTLAACWMLAAAGAFLRDLGEIVALILTALLFMSPVFYPIESVPAALRWVVLLNPISLPVTQVRDLAYFGRMPDVGIWAGSLVVAFVLAWLGHAGFARARRAFADVV